MNQHGDHGAESYFDYNEYLPDACQINLDYAAPEFALDGEISPANDMFSLGCLAYAVHNKGVPLLHTFNNMRSYERKIQALSTMDFSNMPHPLQNVIRRLLARQPSARPSAVEFQSSKYFDNILVSAMKFLESFPEKTREEKGQFMKGLQKVLSQFPERVLKRKILPALLEELKNHQLLPYTIPNVFAIAQQLSQREFCELVLPSLKPVFAVREPPQNMIVLLEKLDVLQQKTPREVFRDDVMPLVYAAIEAPTPVVQEKALRVVPGLAEALDYTTVKNSLFPRVQTLFAQTTILSVKVSTLICFHAMIKLVDKFTMQEKMVPMLRNIKTKEPAVMLATLAVYDEMGKHLDKEIIATEILPQLWRMSFGPLLNVDQFKKFMKTIRELTTRVEEAHTRHLQEVKSLEDQTRSTSAASSPMTNGSFQNGGDQNVSFEELVAGRGAPKADMFDSFAESKPATGLSPMTAPMTTTSTTTDPWASNTGRQSPMGGTLTPASGSSSPRWPSASIAGGGGAVGSSGMGGWSTLNPISPTSTNPVKQPTSMSSIPAIPTPPSFNNTANNSINNNTGSLNNLFSTPSLPPPTSGMSNVSLQANKPSSGPNYAALRGLGGPPQQTQSSRPSSMELLQPISMHKSQGRTSNQSQANAGHKSNNLSAFDPLG
ncbi:hypothetical protein BCR43DRAFT_446307 [Syncephalastrum racemosum]|uniref:Protein kinase domain-containing protein n=1 Tax=Syncephalastrum racemosum TaxID=13706 RepID=A0A1X2H1D2_SYNRA|nr:hypothetical protein BCR43DRAFT_446307 [Syncephalastrum racemosum]